MIVEVNGKKADLSTILPLRIRDWKNLKRKGVTIQNLQTADIDDIATIVYYVLSRANPDITQDDVDGLSIHDPILRQIIEAIGKGEDIDRPT